MEMGRSWELIRSHGWVLKLRVARTLLSFVSKGCMAGYVHKLMSSTVFSFEVTRLGLLDTVRSVLLLKGCMVVYVHRLLNSTVFSFEVTRLGLLDTVLCAPLFEGCMAVYVHTLMNSTVFSFEVTRLGLLDTVQLFFD